MAITKQFVDMQEKIAYLEDKLAESVEIINEWMQLNIEKSAEINQLIQQLAETDKLMQEYLSKCLSLEQQLSEKEKEVEELKKGVYKVTLGTTPSNQIDVTENFYVIQNQTAIAELNNILDTFAIFVNEEKESMVSPDGNGNLSLLEYIENRIDTLKGEK